MKPVPVSSTRKNWKKTKENKYFVLEERKGGGGGKVPTTVINDSIDNQQGSSGWLGSWRHTSTNNPPNLEQFQIVLKRQLESSRTGVEEKENLIVAVAEDIEAIRYASTP